MNYRVLIFGKGLLGSAFEKYLPDNFIHKVVSHKECDIMDFESVKKIVSQFSPEAIINTVALSDVDYCEKHSQEAFIINSGGAGYLASISRDRGIKFVHISTDYVFDGSYQDKYREEDIPAPLSVYARSKYEGEQLARFTATDSIIVRTQWLFGEFRDTFIDKAIARMMNGDSVDTVSDQYGSPTYVKYVVYGISKLITANQRGIFHVSSEGVCSRVEQLEFICDLLNMDKRLIIKKRWSDFVDVAKRPLRVELSKELLYSATGYRMPDWKSQTEEYIKFRYRRRL